VSFLYPLFTIAALAIAIPILIHLFNFRRYKKVLFPDIRFLKELVEQTQKQSQLKHFLILASRILAILALVFAFAQPFFTKDKDKITQGPKAISIYLDNSFSMGIEQNSLSQLDLAKIKANEVIEGCSVNDRIQLLTNDFGFNENKFLSKQEALQQIGTLKISSKTRQAAIILDKQKQLLSTEPGLTKTIIYISDFQKNSFPLDLKIDDSTEKYFVPISSETKANIAIDTAYFETPSLIMNEANPLTVRLKNYSDEVRNTSLTMKVNGQLKSAINVELKANQTINENIIFNTSIAGNQSFEIFIQDNPVSFDDTFYVSGKVSSNYTVLVLNQSNSNAFLSSVFKPGTQFRMDNTNINAFNLSILKNYSLVILNSVSSLNASISEGLSKYLQGGGNMLVFAPQANSNIATLNNFLSNTAGSSYGQLDTTKSFITNYNKSHDVFRGIFEKTPTNIDLPIAYKHYLLERKAISSEQKLFSFSNSDAFLSAYQVGNGKMYICASSAEISASTFPKSYWFLPILYKMAFMNSANSINAVTLGKNSSVFIDNTKLGDKSVYHTYANNFDAIPEQRSIGNRMQINLNEAVAQAGLYGIAFENSKDTSFVGVNYDRQESELNYWTLNELSKTSKIKNAKWLENSIQLGQNLHSLQLGMPIWKICIALTLLFLIIEVLLIRFLK
jgi:hypothetical protein